jgi:NAD(P)H-dependent FMN reductase
MLSSSHLPRIAIVGSNRRDSINRKLAQARFADVQPGQ